MKPAHRRYSERDNPDWSPRTMSALGARGRLLHIWSPWYPVTSTRRARCASAPRKYTSSPLASAARNGSSGPGGASGPRQASRARRRSRTPTAWAIAPPLSGAPLLDGSNAIASCSPYGCASTVTAGESYPLEMVPSIRNGTARSDELRFCARPARDASRNPRYAAASRSGAEHEIGLVESRPGELAVPYRLAEPVGRRLDIGAVEYLDCRVAAVTARQPGERWPVGDGRVAEVHASFLGRSFEAARGRRRAVAWHPVTIHRRGADLAGPQHRGQALAEAPSRPEEQLVRETEPDRPQHGPA